MARPNPEIVSQNIGWTKREWTGYANTRTDGTHACEFSNRSYYSTNTPGYPDVSPLPFRAHTVGLRTNSHNTCVFYRKYLTGYKVPWYEYTGPQAGSGMGPAAPSLGTLVPDSSLFDNRAEHTARARVIADIQRIKVNVAQNIGERRQVHNMFVTNARRIADGYRALRRGDIRGLSRSIPLRKRHQQNLLNRGPLDIRRAAPSLWLECQYGWLPLLGDVYTGVTNFYKRVEEGYPIRAVGTGFYQTVSSSNTAQTGWIYGSDTYRRRYRCKYIIEYEVDSSNLANMNDWGITNPALLAWELLPYSFVFDWFVPVGDWLQQLDYHLGLYFRRGMKVALVTCDLSRMYKPPADSSTYQHRVTGSDLIKGVKLRREVLSTFPNPGKPRVDKDGLRGKRIANALSLLALAFDRK